MSPHLGMEAIEGHDGPEEEERQVEVVLEQVSEGVAAIGVGTALQSKAGAAQHCEAAAPLEQHLLKIKSACYKPVLDGREQAASSPGAPCLWEARPASLKGWSCPFLSPDPVSIGHSGPFVLSAGIEQRMSWTRPCFGGGDHLVGKAHSAARGLETAGKVNERLGETWEGRALDGVRDV